MSYYSVYNNSNNFNLDEMALYDHVTTTEKKNNMLKKNHTHENNNTYENNYSYVDDSYLQNEVVVEKKTHLMTHMAHYMLVLLVVLVVSFIVYWMVNKMKKHSLTTTSTSYESTTPNFGPDVNVRQIFRRY